MNHQDEYVYKQMEAELERLRLREGALLNVREENERLREENETLRRVRGAYDQELRDEKRLRTLDVARLRRIEEAATRLLHEATEIGEQYDDEDLTELCRILRAALEEEEA